MPCSEYLLLRQSSTDSPVEIGSGKGIVDSSVAGVVGAGTVGVGVGVDGATQPAKITTTTPSSANKNDLFILVSLIVNSFSIAGFQWQHQ